MRVVFLSCSQNRGVSLVNLYWHLERLRQSLDLLERQKPRYYKFTPNNVTPDHHVRFKSLLIHGTFVLSLQPRDKAAMLVDKTIKEIFIVACVAGEISRASVFF